MRSFNWRAYFSVPFNIWMIGFVTFLKNSSSVVLVIFCPFYLTDVLGISMSALGLLEGGVEALSFFSRILAGVLSDSIKKRKPLLVVGYGLSLLGRLFLSLSSTAVGIMISRACERLGNGVQASPRDALVGDFSSPNNRGACFGLRNSLTVLGSVAGAFLAMWFMSWSHNDYRTLFWLTLIPSTLAIVLLVSAVKDSPLSATPGAKKARFKWSDIQKDLCLLPKTFWKTVLLSFMIMLCNFGIVFLIIVAKNFGLKPGHAPLIMVCQSLSTAFFAFPLGRLADAIGKKKMLQIGLVVLMLGNIGLATTPTLWGVFLCVILWGIQMGVMQNTTLSLVADVTPTHLRGTGFGVIHFFNGIATLVANSLTGSLWDLYSHQTAFMVNSAIALCTLFVSPLLLPKRRPMD